MEEMKVQMKLIIKQQEKLERERKEKDRSIDEMTREIEELRMENELLKSGGGGKKERYDRDNREKERSKSPREKVSEKTERAERSNSEFYDLAVGDGVMWSNEEGNEIEENPPIVKGLIGRLFGGDE
ncbi:hypothetical protein TrCOL_g3381 [Triparma columacea]|uniref:Uncharacterized protein n=1 Tax=Triparma columacea TaxID=722753 RepID=A0A9W7L1A0_9STRA|nr:hypothetical protein TrCOL_g3381 [Triparma columacea]